MRYVGQPIPRREDPDLLTGRARTVADLREPDVLELAFVRAEIAHGRLAGVEVAAARAVPGVAGAWSAADLPDLPDVPPGPADEGYEWPSLARGRVRYPGEAVAVVAAPSRAEAEDGAGAVHVEVVAEPAVTDPEVAAGPDAPQLFPGRGNVVFDRELGDDPATVQAAFTGAACVLDARYRQQPLVPSPLEARAVLVRPGPEGGLTVWVSHQAQHRLHSTLVRAFGLEPSRVRVVVPAVGGAFGSKSQTYPEYLVAACLARSLGRPVRWVEDRAEALLAATRGRSQVDRVRLAADAGGRLLAYDLEVDAAAGAYPHAGAGVATNTGLLAPGAYRTPLVRARVRASVTNTAPVSAYRGAGRPEAAFAIERSMDRLARRLGLDPAELRRRNYVTDFPHTTPTGRVYDSGAYEVALEKALQVAGYEELRVEQARRRRQGSRPLGIGMATYVERSGGPEGSDELGAVEVGRDGRFVATVGSTPTGQGHLTVFAQVVADALGVDLDRVEVVEGDTDRVPYGFGSFGSRSLQVGGEALWQAAGALVQAGRERVAAREGVDPARVGYERGRFRCGDGAYRWEELAPLRAERRPGLPQAFPFGAYVAVVEVDPPLGHVHLRRVVAVDDYGVVVNPLIVDGQTQGSVLQGIGQALYEEAALDGDGRPAARSFFDYPLPTMAEVPAVALEETETPNPHVALGAKGAGEAGCIGTPPAVVNAVCDALEVDHIDMPLTPEKVWRAAGCPAA